jgi:hypothetical protein
MAQGYHSSCAWARLVSHALCSRPFFEEWDGTARQFPSQWPLYASPSRNAVRRRHRRIAGHRRPKGTPGDRRLVNPAAMKAILEKPP